jgi:hypothetical protein
MKATAPGQSARTTISKIFGARPGTEPCATGGVGPTDWTGGINVSVYLGGIGRRPMFEFFVF